MSLHNIVAGLQRAGFRGGFGLTRNMRRDFRALTELVSYEQPTGCIAGVPVIEHYRNQLEPAVSVASFGYPHL